MLKRFTLILLLLLACGEAAAQHAYDEYYPYPARDDERTPMLLPDSALFYRAIHLSEDLYASIADFRFSYVGFRRRGLPWSAEVAAVGGVELPYRYFGALRLLGAEERSMPGLALSARHTGRTGGVLEFEFPQQMGRSCYASVHVTDRNCRTGAKVASTTMLGRGWSGTVAADLRTGRDLYIEGVFTNSISVSLRAAKRWDDRCSFDVLLVVPPSLRGLRSTASAEAFTLTGDRLYNPAWGFQDGKVRNSHVRREFVPLALASLSVRCSPRTSLAATVGAECGIRKYSTLGWYDARTPMPDNYRYMPGWSGDRETAEAWRANNPRYTQIDWDELVAQNRMAAGHAVYALEDRAERLCNLNLNALFTTETDLSLTLRYGLLFRWSDTRSYKQMRDLLGARYIVDIDQYLVDDDTYGNLLQNELRHPDRVIAEGDRFGYDYALTVRDAGVRFQAEYRADRFRADVGFVLREVSVFRRGYYEKELFPGEGSYGRSRRVRFMPYTLKALVGWAFSPESYLEAAVMAGSEPPAAGDLFFQPQYNNRIVDDPAPERSYAAEVNYRMKSRALNLQLTAFAVLSLDGSETRRYYDDLAGVFCDMAVSGVGVMACGLEAAADVRLSQRWSLSLAASAGSYRYVRNPSIAVLSDVDHAVVESGARSHMKGFTPGGAPQLSGCVELGYFGPKGWGVRASGAFAAGRYVEPTPLRRTERVARQGGTTPELFDAITQQERLDDALSVDASLFKSFRFGRSRLTVTLMLRNLLGERETVYGGYEALRVQRRRAGDATHFVPQATRYTYSYPRSFYLTVSYKL